MQEIIKSTATEIMLAITAGETRWAGTPEAEINDIYDQLDEAGEFFDPRTDTMYRLQKQD